MKTNSTVGKAYRVEKFHSGSVAIVDTIEKKDRVFTNSRIGGAVINAPIESLEKWFKMAQKVHRLRNKKTKQIFT